MDDLSNLSLKELFDESDRIGNQYLTPEEIEAHKQEVQRLRDELLINFTWYAERTRHERQ